MTSISSSTVCVVWKVNLARAADLVQEGFGLSPHQCTRYRDLLALEDVDAVVIATPDFAHTPIFLAALEAGKDVYVEKPMALDIGEASRALDMARQRGRVVQVGTQYRSHGGYRAAARELATGVLGRISRVSASANFNEPRWARPYDDCKAEDVDWEGFLLGHPLRSFDPKLLRRWHLYREFTNGLSGLWMSHYVDARPDHRILTTSDSLALRRLRASAPTDSGQLTMIVGPPFASARR